MTGLERATDIINNWTPWFTVIGLGYGGYRKVKKNVTAWAGTLLDNHAAHAQASLGNIEKAQSELLGLAKETNTILTRIAEKN